MTAQTANKPATPLQPLPFSIGSINRTIAAADGEYVAEVASDRDGKYIVTACNAYPELVAALRNIIESKSEIVPYEAIRALLAKLGEG